VHHDAQRSGKFFDACGGQIEKVKKDWELAREEVGEISGAGLEKELSHLFFFEFFLNFNSFA
jgi:hypothetical protein